MLPPRRCNQLARQQRTQHGAGVHAANLRISGAVTGCLYATTARVSSDSGSASAAASTSSQTRAPCRGTPAWWQNGSRRRPRESPVRAPGWRTLQSTGRAVCGSARAAGPGATAPSAPPPLSPRTQPHRPQRSPQPSPQPNLFAPQSAGSAPLQQRHWPRPRPSCPANRESLARLAHQPPRRALHCPHRTPAPAPGLPPPLPARSARASAAPKPSVSSAWPHRPAVPPVAPASPALRRHRLQLRS